MDILSVTSECAPLIKTGGLADVVGALPAALAPLGITVRTLLPGYPAVTKKISRKRAEITFDNLFGGPAKVRASNVDGLDLLVLDAPHLFDRDGAPYNDLDGKDWPDNAERFAALSFAAAQIAGEGLKKWQPDILHCHDWQAGFAPDYLKKDFPDSAVKSVITIHNVAFQGNVAADKLSSLQLPPERMTSEGFEYWGQISSLKAAITLADRITTVSPTYAEELLTPEFGMGLDGVLRSRRDVLSGILNGVDLDVWNPPFKTPAGKASHKEKLRKIGRAHV